MMANSKIFTVMLLTLAVTLYGIDARPGGYYGGCVGHNCGSLYSCYGYGCGYGYGYGGYHGGYGHYPYYTSYYYPSYWG